jgi:GT2 family glycosyltransferase
MKNIKTSLVVLNYNDYKTTIDFIKMIKKYNNIDLIVVVDNNSTDGSYDKLKKYESNKINVIASNKNGGYGYGNNVGIKYATQKLGNCNIIISNPDIEVSESIIDELIKKLNSDDDYAIMAPIILENGVENKGWRLPSIFADVLQNLPYIHRFFKKLQLYPSKWYNEKCVEVEAVSGCFFIVGSDIMKKINYFDEGLFLYYEENVIGKKIKNIGKKIIIDTTSNVTHHHSISVNNSVSSLNKYRILKRSQMYYHKNYDNAGLIGKFMLYGTSKITEAVLYIYYLLKQGGRK